MNFAMVTLGLKEFSRGNNSWVLLENAEKNLVFHFGVGHHASFPQKPFVKAFKPQISGARSSTFSKILGPPVAPHAQTSIISQFNRDNFAKGESWLCVAGLQFSQERF